MSSPYKVYGANMSTCTRTVLATLEEVGANYELVPVDMAKGEHKSPDYIAKQHPFGKIPVMWDGDFKLFESLAIARYVADKAHADTLYPKDAKKRALVEQWLSVYQSNQGPFVDIVVEFMFGPLFFGRQGDAGKVAALTQRLNALLDIFEAQLQTTKFLAGNDFTLADLAWLPFGTYMLSCAGFENAFDGHAHVKAWWTAISTRPAWKKISGK